MNQITKKNNNSHSHFSRQKRISGISISTSDMIDEMIQRENERKRIKRKEEKKEGEEEEEGGSDGSENSSEMSMTEKKFCEEPQKGKSEILRIFDNRKMNRLTLRFKDMKLEKKFKKNVRKSHVLMNMICFSMFSVIMIPMYGFNINKFGSVIRYVQLGIIVSFLVLEFGVFVPFGILCMYMIKKKKFERNICVKICFYLMFMIQTSYVTVISIVQDTAKSLNYVYTIGFINVVNVIFPFIYCLLFYESLIVYIKDFILTLLLFIILVCLDFSKLYGIYLVQMGGIIIAFIVNLSNIRSEELIHRNMILAEEEMREKKKISVKKELIAMDLFDVILPSEYIPILKNYLFKLKSDISDTLSFASTESTEGSIFECCSVKSRSGDIVYCKYEEICYLQADICNFSEFSDNISPIDLIQVLNKIYSAFDEMIGKYRFSKLSTVGDCYIAFKCIKYKKDKKYWYENHLQIVSEKACILALSMIDKLKELNIALSIRVGICIDNGFVTIVGGGKYGLEIYGRCGYICGMLESNSKHNKISVCENIYLSTQKIFNYEEKKVIKDPYLGEIKSYVIENTTAVVDIPTYKIEIKKESNREITRTEKKGLQRSVSISGNYSAKKVMSLYKIKNFKQMKKMLIEYSRLQFVSQNQIYMGSVGAFLLCLLLYWLGYNYIYYQFLNYIVSWVVALFSFVIYILSACLSMYFIRKKGRLLFIGVIFNFLHFISFSVWAIAARSFSQDSRISWENIPFAVCLLLINNSSFNITPIITQLFFSIPIALINFVIFLDYESIPVYIGFVLVFLLLNYKKKMVFAKWFLFKEEFIRVKKIIKSTKEVNRKLLSCVIPKEFIGDFIKSTEKKELLCYKVDQGAACFVKINSFHEDFFKEMDNYSDNEIEREISLIRDLECLFLQIEEFASKYNCYKIKTYQNMILITSGIRNEHEYIKQTAEFCLDTRDFLLSGNKKIDFTIGLSFGPFVTSIVGTQNYLMDCFGTTLNIAYRTSCESFMIHFYGEQAYENLKYNFVIEKREKTCNFKGFSNLQTYFLVNKM